MIALFSATGNSRLVARALSPLLGDEPVADILTLSPASVAGEKRIVWVFPIHAWSVPGVVEEAIGRLTFDPSTEHYMVATCGDDCGRADRAFRRLVESHGGHVVGCFSVRMPNTYVLLPGMDTDSPSVEADKLLAAPARIRFIAKSIRHRASITDLTPGAFPALKSGLLRWAFRRFLMSPRPFHALPGQCTGCGVCVRSCPLANITMASDRLPRWADRCATCLACYHACPSHAVAYGRRTTSKGQYKAPSRLPEP